MKSAYTQYELETLKAIGDAGPGGITEHSLNTKVLARLRRKRTQVVTRRQVNQMVRLTAAGRRVYTRLANAHEGTWEAVEVMGHQLHVGRVREVDELGKRFLRIAAPAYVHDRMRYAPRVFTLAPAAIFRRTQLSEDEARTRLGQQTAGGLGVPLPGRRLADARAELGGYDLRPHRAAELLGIEPMEYAAIESCKAEISEARADELIAALTAAWGAAPVQPAAPRDLDDADDLDDDEEVGRG